jgi:hypothetical protein
LKNIVILTPFKKMVLLVAPLFDLGVDFDVFLSKHMGFLGQSSHFEVTVLIKSVTLLEVLFISPTESDSSSTCESIFFLLGGGACSSTSIGSSCGFL